MLLKMTTETSLKIIEFIEKNPEKTFSKQDLCKALGINPKRSVTYLNNLLESKILNKVKYDDDKRDYYLLNREVLNKYIHTLEYFGNIKLKSNC